MEGLKIWRDIMRELKRSEIMDILMGCTVLGTGGGGPIEMGIEMIDTALEAGKRFHLINLDEIPNEDVIVTPYYCGAVSPDEEETINKFKHLEEVDKHPVIRAVQEMERHIEKSIQGVVPTELGGANTAAALMAGAMMDKYIIDGDPAGRAVPELQHSTYFINNLKMAPIAIANTFGETAIFGEILNDFRAEAMVRSIAVESKNIVAVADHISSGSEIRDKLIPGTLTYAEKIGCAIRQAKEENKNIGEAIARAGNGIVAFTGIVDDFNWKTEDGFTVGDVVLKGTDKFEGNQLKTWFKNEHIASWLNDAPYVNAPDLLCVIHSETGNPITNPNYEKGMPLTIIALPAPKEWTIDSGLEVFSAKYFGFDIEYVPFTNRVNASGKISTQR